MYLRAVLQQLVAVMGLLLAGGVGGPVNIKSFVTKAQGYQLDDYSSFPSPVPLWRVSFD